MDNQHLQTITSGRGMSSPMGIQLNDRALWQEGACVLFLSGCTWACSGGGQRPVALARAFGQDGYNVLYHNDIDPRSYWAGGPLILNRSTLDGAFNLLTRQPGTVIVGLVPYWPLAKQFQDAGWKVIFDVVDDWRAFNQSGDASWFDGNAELEALKQADVVTCSAPRLRELVKGATGRQSILIRNAGPDAPFAPAVAPEDLVRGKAGTVVYVGYMQGSWFDWELLKQTALDLPEVSFNMVGATYPNIPRLPNLNYVGERPYPIAMNYLQQADVAIIPFRHETLCASVDPIKYYDHVAARVWTVSSWVMSDLKNRPWNVVAEKQAFSLAPAIKEALKHKRPTAVEAAEWLEKNSWRFRQLQFAKVMEMLHT